MSFVFSHNITREGSLHKDDMLDNNKGKVQTLWGHFWSFGLIKTKVQTGLLSLENFNEYFYDFCL